MPARRVRERAHPQALTSTEERPRVLIDTNIVIDLLLDRAPWGQEAALLFDALYRGRCMGFVAAHAVGTVHYIVERERNRRVASASVADLLGLVDVVPLDTNDFQRALTLALKDYEDALQAVAAFKIEAHCVVTRNQRDFKGAGLRTLTAREVLAALAV